MKITINSNWDIDQIKENLENPKQGDTYSWSRDKGDIKIVIGTINEKTLFYYKRSVRFEIPINELENLITSIDDGWFEFYNHYDNQEYIKEEKLKNPDYFSKS